MNCINNLLSKCIFYSNFIRNAEFDMFFMLRNAIKDLLSRSNIYITKEDFAVWIENNSIINNLIKNHQYWAISKYQGKYYLVSYIEGDLYGWITLDSNVPIDCDVNSEHLLTSYKNIPSMWLWIGTLTKELPIEASDVNLAHNSFIIDALRRLSPFLAKPNITNKDLVSFIKENSSKISDIRKHLSGQPEYLGSGSDGVAYSINNNMVLKIFLDGRAYSAAIQAIDRLHENPLLAKTEAMIYDANVLGNLYGEHIYYYIIEKMTPVMSYTKSDYIEEILELIVFHIEHYYNKELRKLKLLINDDSKSKIISETTLLIAKNIINKISDKHSKLIEIILNSFQLNDNWLLSLTEEIIMKYLTGRTDLHTGNIGVTQYGNLRYFDPAFSKWTSKINLG
jgi:hypothetical protein